MSRFDRVVLALVLGLGLTIAALSVAVARIGPTVDSLSTAQSLDGTLVNSQIAVAFTQPMKISPTERAFSIRPAVKGDFSWSGNQLLFVPRTSLRYDQTYIVTISTAAQDAGGKHLGRSFQSSFTTQGRHLMYLGTDGSERDRLILASTDGKREAVAGGNGPIRAFNVSFDRTLAVYVRQGSSSERPDELWLLSLADNSTQRVFRQPDWTITQPHFSPDGRYIAFLARNVRICRKYYGCYRDTSGPLIYLFDLQTHRAFPYNSSSDVPITNFIDFSPRGQLAFTDLGSALTVADVNGHSPVHIPNAGNSLEFAGFDPAGDKAVFVGQTPSSTGGDILMYASGRYTDLSKGVYDSSTPSFSSSGKRVAYAAYRGEKGIEPLYGVNVYTIADGRTQRLTAETTWSDWAPQWSPDDVYIAFVRSEPQEAMYLGAGEVWVMRSDGKDARPLGGVGQDIRWVL